jgi:hypothetical protein
MAGRRGAGAAVAAAIQAHGWRAPVTVSKRSGLAVRGHGRLAAAAGRTGGGIGRRANGRRLRSQVGRLRLHLNGHSHVGRKSRLWTI